MSQAAPPAAPAGSGTSSDVPADLEFVDPTAAATTGWRCCLWAAPGQGKSVAAASAPGPLLVLRADRPNAYRFARRHHGAAVEIREVAYQDFGTLNAVRRYLATDAGRQVATVVLDPFSLIYDQLVDTAPARPDDGEPDYQRVNKALLQFLTSLRQFDVNVVLVAHEKLNDGKKGDGKLYPALGGPSLINKVLAEMDIVAHIERVVREPRGQEGQPPPEGAEPEVVYVGQLQPRGNLVCKESTGVLGSLRVANLTRWFEVASEGLAVDQPEVPWDPPPDGEQEPGQEGPPADDDDASGEAAAEHAPAAAGAGPAAPRGRGKGKGKPAQASLGDGPDELPSKEEAEALRLEALAASQASA